MAIFDILGQGMNYLDKGLSSLGQSINETKLETFGSDIFGDDREGFSREELEAEFQKEIEPEAGTLSAEQIEQRRSKFFQRKQEELDILESKEPGIDYSAYKAPQQQSTRPSSITAPKPSLGSPSFRAVDDRAYSQIERGLNIVDLNKLLDEAMGTRAKVNVFNSLFGGRGLL